MTRFRWLSIVISIVFLLSLMASSSTVAQEGTGEEANKATLMAFWEAEAARNYDGMDAFFVEDFVRHSAATTSVMPEVQVTNREEYVQFLQGMAASFPDYYTTPQMLVAEGDYVGFYCLWTGTFAETGNLTGGPMMGFARFEDGKMAELWIEWDSLTWTNQMTATAAETTEEPVSNIEDVVGLSATAEEENSAETNKATLMAFWQAEATRSYGEIVHYVDRDFIRHSVASTAVMPEMQVTNRAEYGDFLRGTAAMFPDYYVTLEMLVAEGDYVSFYSIFYGTFVENGNRIEIPMVGVARFSDGKMVELWIEWDNITWNAQMMAEPIETTEVPVSSIDDVSGITRLYTSDWALFAGHSADGHYFVGPDPTECAGNTCVDSGEFSVENGQLRYLTSSYSTTCGEATYNAFVVMQDGEPVGLRTELVGDDCHSSRKASLDGKITYFVEE